MGLEQAHPWLYGLPPKRTYGGNLSLHHLPCLPTDASFIHWFGRHRLTQTFTEHSINGHHRILAAFVGLLLHHRTSYVLRCFSPFFQRRGLFSQPLPAVCLPATMLYAACRTCSLRGLPLAPMLPCVFAAAHAARRCPLSHYGSTGSRALLLWTAATAHALNPGTVAANRTYLPATHLPPLSDITSRRTAEGRRVGTHRRTPINLPSLFSYGLAGANSRRAGGRRAGT